MALTDKKPESREPVVLGRISGLFGVSGWVKVFSYTEPRDAILDYRECLLKRDGTWQPATVAEGKRHGKTVIMKIAGVDDRDGADALIGTDIGVPRERMPQPGDGHYYWADLEGLAVEDKDGRALGTVAYLLATGSNDVLVVQGDREILIPFVPDSVILDVDLAAGRIRVDWDWD